MLLHQNISLKPFNSFHIDAKAKYFARFSSTDELQELLEYSRINLNGNRVPTVLGGGSNILFVQDLDGLVLKNEIMGITLVHEDEEYVYVKVGAGENWHSFVQYCIEHNWAGVENLSLIPGTVGAAPIQNIGAYGVELQEVFWSLEAYHIKFQTPVTFTAGDCRFGYRNSAFKTKYKGDYVITTVSFQLKKKPVFHTSYGAIQQELEAMGISKLSIRAISDAVIRIRSSKLPDPNLIGNAGSFFKNPELFATQFNEIKNRFPDIVSYELPGGMVKLAGAWLIEHSGPSEEISWKGFRRGDAGLHEKQPLVLVNYGNASGEELLELSQDVIQSVKDKFGVTLEREVNLLP